MSSDDNFWRVSKLFLGEIICFLLVVLVVIGTIVILLANEIFKMPVMMLSSIFLKIKTSS